MSDVHRCPESCSRRKTRMEAKASAEQRRGRPVLDLTCSALCISLLCVCSYIVVPLPFTPAVLSLHSAAACLAGFVLRPKHAAAAVAVYILMGLIGLPVFAGAASGAGKLFGPTGGFYFGFLLSAVIVSALKGSNPSFRRYAAVCLLTVPVSHACAVLVVCMHNGFNAQAAFLTISLPFIPGDVAKAALCAAIGKAVARIRS